MHEVTKYLNSNLSVPFFVIVGDDEYVAAKEKLSSLGLDAVGISKYCTADRLPNIDRLFEDLKNGEVKVLVGLGEYLSLCGEAAAFDILSKLQDFNLHGNKTVLLLRGVAGTIKKLQANDLRFDNKRVFYLSEGKLDISMTCVPHSFELPGAIEGLNAILRTMERGLTTRIIAKTKREFASPLIDVRSINTAFDGIKHWIPSFILLVECGDDEMWKELMAALNAANGSIEAVFRSYGLSEHLLDDFDLLVQGVAFKNWLYFIALKLKINKISNTYLRYVLDVTTKVEDFKDNILNTIIEISPSDIRFEQFFKERNLLVEYFSEADIASFVRDNRVNLEDSLYRLTNRKSTEREELIALFGTLEKEKVLNRIKVTYPALYEYLHRYSFSDTKIDVELRTLFTDYFDKYKWQKVLNRLDDEFVRLVEDLALSTERKYNLLRSRNEIINGIDKSRTKLYWLDALGVEFLGFLQTTCKKMGLALTIHIGRAELPTSTELNKDFYVDWQSEDKVSDKRLDKVKHNGGADGGYNYENNTLPIHLQRELEIIEDVIEKIAVDLMKHKYGKILLTSDHGASRLAVIKEQEEKYETDTTSEHSGRCCKFLDDYELPFATEENGYLVLANYGRFRGSRKANVEVHGGASLEEVLVPIIEITLARPNIKVRLVKEAVYTDYKTFAIIEIFSNIKLNNVKVVIEGKQYESVRKDDNHYIVTTDIKRARTYRADIFDGDSPVGTVSFTAQGKNKSNNDFEF